MAASRAVARHLSRAFSPRSPLHWVMDRPADQGTITSTPISVIVSTAVSPRSPLGSAWTTMIRGLGAGSEATVSTSSSSFSLCATATTHPATAPAPSHRSTRSPGFSRRTRAAWRPSGPSSRTRAPRRAVAAACQKKTGAVLIEGSLVLSAG